ncbi:MAG: formyltransferase family protein [Rhodomicrobium sp.]
MRSALIHRRDGQHLIDNGVSQVLKRTINVNLVLLADGIMGKRIAAYLIENYPSDIGTVVTVADNEITKLCRAAQIKTFRFVSEKSAMAQLKDTLFDLGILAWWPRIIREELIALPRRGFFNTHPSLLPHNRGTHPNFWALVEQAPFGVTLHQVNEAIDSGPIVAQHRIPYDWTDTGETLYSKAKAAIFKLFVETYPKLRLGEIPSIPQDLSLGSFHRSSELDPASRFDLDGKYTARDILNRLRARTFRGHPACWFEDNGETFEVRVEITRKST